MNYLLLMLRGSPWPWSWYYDTRLAGFWAKEQVSRVERTVGPPLLGCKVTIVDGIEVEFLGVKSRPAISYGAIVV